MSNRSVARSLALVSAYRQLMGLEVEAAITGKCAKHFGDGDRLTVERVPGGFTYLWVDGPVPRDTAAAIISTGIDDE